MADSQESKPDITIGVSQVPSSWINTISTFISERGFPTTIACVLTGIIVYAGKLGVDELKESQRYNRDKVTKIAESAIEAQGASNIIIENNTEALGDIKSVAEDNRRFIERAMIKLEEDDK
jgi:hypothetical protein